MATVSRARHISLVGHHGLEFDTLLILWGHPRELSPETGLHRDSAVPSLALWLLHLRTLELIGRTDIPVVPGAEYPLMRTREETLDAEQRYGSIVWLGAWTPKYYHAPRDLGSMPEGQPTTKPANEDAAHFLIRMVHKYPHEVTIEEAGPMTNLALAITLDPEFASLAKELVFMGASLNPRTDDPEFINAPRHEFNLWFDPEAAHIVLRAPWKNGVTLSAAVTLAPS